MKHLLFTLAIALLFGSSASAQTGRTDGAEESEFGKGGYPFGGRAIASISTPPLALAFST